MNIQNKILLLLLSTVSLYAQSSLIENGILNKDSKLKTIVKDLKFTEGPLWIEDKKMLLFSDIPTSTQYKWTKEKGLEVYNRNNTFANGNMLDNNGNIITARHDRTVTKTFKDNKTIVIADEYQSKKLNSPNDLALYKDGSIYFTDPHFGLIGYGPNKAKEEQEYRGIYKLDEKGNVLRVAQELSIPNGLAFSNDYKKLYVSNSFDGNIYIYDVLKNGKLNNLRLFTKQIIEKGQAPIGDGLKVDKKGNIYASGANGVNIYNKNAKYIGTIKLEKYATNVNFGGNENKTLFITSHDKVYSIKTNIGK